MEDIKMDYNKLLKLIHKLPREDFEKLVITLSSELKSLKQTPKEKLRHLILKAPTWNDQQFNEYQQAREFINKSRLG